MIRKILTYVENVVVIAAVGVPVHYFTGLEWPWAIVIGAAASIALRWLIRRGMHAQVRKPPVAGGR